jgi:hypothetical protein
MNWRAARKGASSLDLLYRAAYSPARPGTARPRLTLSPLSRGDDPIEVIQREKRDLDRARSGFGERREHHLERAAGRRQPHDIEGRVPDGGKSPGTQWASVA